jgi:hypothetical protein
MIKTVIKNEPNLFEEITVNVFSNNNGNRSFEQKTLKVAKLGNSVTWKYSIDEDGRALFFRVDRFGDYHDETEVVDVCGCDYPIYVGDYIWFRSEGKFSTWGKMIPPKNPARRAMWENFYFVQKQACYCDTPQLKYDTIINRWDHEIEECCSEGKFKTLDVKHIYCSNRNKPIVSALIRRSWSNQKWRISELVALDGINGDRLYNNVQKICQMVNRMNTEAEEAKIPTSTESELFA